MFADEYRELCLKKKGVSEGFPFGEPVLVFKVMGKMFALANIDKFDYINLKCDPIRSVKLRETFPGITPGYHMDKKHWNSVKTDGSIPEDLLIELIDHSYELIVKSLPKKVQEELKHEA